MFDNTIAEDKSYAERTMNKHGYTVIQEVMQGCKEKNLKKYSKKNRNSCGAILLEMVDIFPAVAFHN